MNPESSNLGQRLSQLRAACSDPAVLFPVLIIGGIIFAFSFSESKRWWLIAVWVFLLSLARFVGYGTWNAPPFPFDQMVTYGRTVGTIMMFLMLPAAWTYYVRNPNGRIPPAAWALYLFYMTYCVRYLPTSRAVQAGVRIVLYSALFFFLAMSLPRWITSARELVRSMGAAAFSITLLALGSAVSYLVSPGTAMWNQRFFGLTSNPNHLGMDCALAVPILLGLVLWKYERQGWRIFWSIAAGMVAIALIWTGSRGPMGVVAVAAVVFFRIKLGNLIFVAVPLAVSIWGLSFFFEDSFASAQRFTDFTDTRTGGWALFYEEWMRSPVLGNAELSMAVTENSFLTLLANTGMFGLAASIFLVAVWGNTCLKLLRLRPIDKNIAVLRDIALAGLVAVLAASVFEGILLSSVNPTTFFVFYYCLIAQVAVQAEMARQPAYQYVPPEHFAIGR